MKKIFLFLRSLHPDRSTLFIGIILYSLLFANCFAQWTTTYTNPPTQHFECFFVNENTGWLGGDGCKVFKTTNCGNNWDSVYSPSTSNIIYCMYFTNASTGWAGTFSGDVLKTTNGGVNWTSVQAVYNKRIWDVFFINVNTGWCVGGEGTLRKTTDAGNNWFNPSTNFFPSEAYGIYFLNSQTGFACGLYGIARTTDGGNNWNIGNYPQNYFTAMYFLNSNTGWIIGGCVINGNAIGLYVLKTTNNGINWNVICSDTVATGYFINVKDVHFVNENLGYIVGIGGYMPPPSSNYAIMRKTTNGGISWNNVSYGYTTSNLEAITFVNQQTGFATGGSGAVYKTTNGGPSFIKQISGTVPDKFNLYQNFPNPFNPSTTIKYSVPMRSPTRAFGDDKVVLKVYDILGKEITTLVNEKLKPGTYEVTFDGFRLPSGIYFYKLIVRDPESSSGQVYSETKKMILLK